MGAPQAPALPSQAANRTGGLFACPLTSEPSDCWRVPIDEGGEGDIQGGFRPLSCGAVGLRRGWGWGTGVMLPMCPLHQVDLQRESKENQWLGVSVKSQGAGGKIVVSTRGSTVGRGGGGGGGILELHGADPAVLKPRPVPIGTKHGTACSSRWRLGM